MTESHDEAPAQEELQQLAEMIVAYDALKSAQRWAWIKGVFLAVLVLVILIYSDEISPRKGLKAVIVGVAAAIGSVLCFIRAVKYGGLRKHAEYRFREMGMTDEALRHVKAMMGL